MERTLIVIKPDAVGEGNIGEILSRFERAGFQVVGMKMITFDEDLVRRLYGQHEKKDFYTRNAQFIMGGRSVLVVLEGEDVINAARRMLGKLGEPGTLRGDYGSENPKNAVHASDSPAAAELEIRRLFG
jgi:nucleoside-diphosphate kinase